MRYKNSYLVFLIVLVLISGCIKETYDMHKLSKEVHLSPTLAMNVVNGSVSLNNLVESSDTLIIDEDNFMRVVISEDSVINLKMTDVYDLNNMISFNQTYQVGELSIAPFYESFVLTLNQISSNFSAPLRAQFVAMDNTTNNFPAFLSTDLGETSFSPLSNFEYALFSTGAIDISLMNNLPAPLDGVTIQLFNASDHSPIGNAATISVIPAGEQRVTTIDVAGVTVTNNIVASVVLDGSPGTSTPVLIDLDGSNVEIGISGRDLLVNSGRVVIPVQMTSTLDNKDTITFDAGTDIELDQIKINSGFLTYSFQSSTVLQSNVSFTLPSVLKDGSPIQESISVASDASVNGSISVDNSIFDLGTDPLLPYNRVPLEYTLEVSSSGMMVDFDKDDQLVLDFELLNPDFDYLKGYFGQNVESIDPDSIDLDIDDIIGKITGDFLISSPSISLNYSNSFSIPMEIELNAIGSNESESVNLGLLPFPISFPAAPADRDIDDSYVIDKSNSYLPDLISLPPSKIKFSGSASMNPDGNDGLRNNYIFGDSRFLGSMEIEVPLEFRFSNFQFADTVENFMKIDDDNSDSSISPEDFDFLRVSIKVKNGFPLGVSLKMSLYDSLSHSINATVDATDIITPAPVDNNGRATGVSESTTNIELSSDFFNSINSSDQVIFEFTLNTTDDGTKDVKIYSDYNIDFSAILVLKPDINLK